MVRGQEEATKMPCGVWRAQGGGGQAALHRQSCPQDGLSGPGARALSCQ